MPQLAACTSCHSACFLSSAWCSATPSLCLHFRLQQLYTGVKVQHTFSAVFTGLAFSLQYQHHRPQPHVQQNSLLLQSRRPITSQDILALLAADPCITVYPDRRGILRGTAPAPAAAAAAADAASRKPCTAAASSCDIGNSMRRIRAAMGNKVHGAASVGVAVIDTGVAAHPDLNIVQSINCIGSGSSINGYLQLGQSSSCSVLPSHFDHVGHSTLVAGIIGAKSLQVQQQRSFTAKERRRRVTGVAPGTPLFSLHVVQSDASPPKPFYSFTVSDVIAALDWVLLFNAKNTSRQGLGANAKIRVVNLSLGDYSQQQYSGTDGISLVDNPAYPDCGAGHPSVDPWHTAICRVAVDRENGAVVVAAAGNTAEDIQTSVPGEAALPDLTRLLVCPILLLERASPKCVLKCRPWHRGQLKCVRLYDQGQCSPGLACPLSSTPCHSRQRCSALSCHPAATQ